jgi:hypothetical protein
MKQPQRQRLGLVDRNLVLRDLHRLGPNLLRPVVLLGISELPEQRRALYVARLKQMHAWLEERAEAA